MSMEQPKGRRTASVSAVTPVKDHLAFVDGLRAVAILLVIVFHATEHAANSSPFVWWRRVGLIGQHGVDLFFVISGFCLAYPVLCRIHAGAPITFDYVGFAAKRLTRIFPPYWVTVVLLLVASAFPAWRLVAPTSQAIPLHYNLGDVVRAAFLFDREPLLSGSFWTLGLELRWYFVFPIALALFIKSRRAFLASCAFLWALSYWSAAEVIDTRILPCFFLGILCAAVYLERPAWTRYAAIAFWAALAGAIVLDSAGRGPVWQIAFFCFMLWAIESRAMRAVLAWKPLMLVGTASYSIYLVHEPVIAYFDALQIPFVVSGLGGLVAGIAFWYVCERLMMQPATRKKFVAWTRALIERALFVPIPSRMKDSAQDRVTAVPAAGA